MWTIRSFFYTLYIFIESLVIISALCFAFILCGYILSGGHWNPMEYTLIGKCLFILWAYIVIKSTIEIQKAAIAKDEMEFENNSEEIE